MKNPTRFGLSGLLAFITAVASAVAVKRDQPPSQVVTGIAVFTIAWLVVWRVLRWVFPR